MDPKSPTLDQIAVFLAIVETGSFAAAGRKLGRATSAISYAIANLEAQLGLSLFVRAGASKPRLTEAGRAILSDGRGLAMALDGLIAKARGLTQGLEAEVSLVVDVMLPAKRVVKALEEFRRKFPTVGLRLRVEALGAVTQAVLNRDALFGLSGPLEMTNDLLVRGPAGAVKLIPVAHPDHPLAGMGKVTGTLARDHVQLVLTDRSTLTAGHDLGAKHALLLAGLGWGSMPKQMVSDDIKRGRLVRLSIDAWDNVQYDFHTVHRLDTPLGPAASWLMERLAMERGA